MCTDVLLVLLILRIHYFLTFLRFLFLRLSRLQVIVKDIFHIVLTGIVKCYESRDVHPVRFAMDVNCCVITIVLKPENASLTSSLVLFLTSSLEVAQPSNITRLFVFFAKLTIWRRVSPTSSSHTVIRILLGLLGTSNFGTSCYLPRLDTR